MGRPNMTLDPVSSLIYSIQNTTLEKFPGNLDVRRHSEFVVENIWYVRYEKLWLFPRAAEEKLYNVILRI